MARRRKHPLVAAGIIERHDNHVLIALPTSADATHRLWQFPRAQVQSDESPEDGMRRFCQEEIGLNVEIVVGQPPLIVEIDGQECEVRFFFCGIIAGEAKPGLFQEIRWVSHAHLREYDFDPPSQPVVDWILEQNR